VIRRIWQLVLDRGDGVARDFGIRPLVEDRQADFDVVRDGDDPGHAFGGLFGFELLRVTPHEAGQRDDAVFYRHCDIGRVDVWVPPELRFHVPFDIDV
jgi:hypothetical protein